MESARLIGRPRRPWLNFIAVGLAGAIFIVGLYLGLISLAQGPDHAVYQLRVDLPFVLAVATGFGIQIGLFAELRAIRSRHSAAGALTVAGAGAGSAAMLACCAHHLVDVLPLIGLSTAAVFLNDYRTPLMVLSLSANALGIAIIGRQLISARRSCAPRVAQEPVRA
jgi:hypothetical protein